MLALIILGVGCRAAAVEAGERNPLREQARNVLETSCGRCHDGALATAKPAALAIYDLSKPDFAARMTPAQLASALRRLEKQAPAADLAVFSQFVALELARKR